MAEPLMDSNCVFVSLVCRGSFCTRLGVWSGLLNPRPMEVGETALVPGMAYQEICTGYMGDM